MDSPRRSYLGGALLIILGSLFLLQNFGVADVSDLISTYWPIILVLIGLNILLRKRLRPVYSAGEPDRTLFPDTIRATSSSFVNRSTVFGDIDLRMEAKDFAGGTVSCTFGDVNLDLSSAELADGEHLLRLDGVFGGIHVLVPKGTAIFATARTVFGDVNILGNSRNTGIGQELAYTSPEYAAAAKKLRIYAHQVFGDIRIW